MDKNKMFCNKWIDDLKTEECLIYGENFDCTLCSHYDHTHKWTRRRDGRACYCGKIEFGKFVEEA